MRSASVFYFMDQISQSKQCAKCKTPKPLEQFYVKKGQPFNRAARCISCTKEDHQASYLRRREKALAYSRQPEVRARAKARKKHRYWNDTEHRERMRAKERARGQTPKRIAQRKARSKRLWADSPSHRVRSTLHKSIRRALKGVSQKTETLKGIVGCDLASFLRHIESLFRPGMMWDNHGVGRECWHIDHVRPVASFDLSQPEQVKVCFHYTNLQPLWCRDNVQKGDKMPHEVDPSLLPAGFNRGSEDTDKNPSCALWRAARGSYRG